MMKPVGVRDLVLGGVFLLALAPAVAAQTPRKVSVELRGDMPFTQAEIDEALALRAPEGADPTRVTIAAVGDGGVVVTIGAVSRLVEVGDRTGTAAARVVAIAVADVVVASGIAPTIAAPETRPALPKRSRADAVRKVAAKPKGPAPLSLGFFYGVGDGYKGAGGSISLVKPRMRGAFEVDRYWDDGDSSVTMMRLTVALRAGEWFELGAGLVGARLDLAVGDPGRRGGPTVVARVILPLARELSLCFTANGDLLAGKGGIGTHGDEEALLLGYALHGGILINLGD